MDKIQDENLFDIRVTPEGLLSLINSAKTIKLLFKLAMLANTLVLLNLILLEFFYFKKGVISTHGRIVIISTVAYPLMALLDIAILFWQFYVFRQFGVHSANAMKESDELLFNQSFKFFYRYTRIACLQIFVVLIMYLISIYTVVTMISTS